MLTMLVRNVSRLLVAILALGLSVTTGRAADGFEPTPTFAMESRSALGLEPKDVILSGKYAYVLGINADGSSAIERRDAGSLELIDTRSVTFNVDDIAADPEGDVLYAIGNDGVASRFQVLDLSLEPLGGVTIRPRIWHPTLNTTPDKLVAVSSLLTESSEGFFAAVDVRDTQRPILRDDFYSRDARRGVMNGWPDAQNGVIFLNSAWDSRLYAVSTGKSYVMSEFGVQTASGLSSEPYAIAAQLGHDPCGTVQTTSFLVADMTRDVLSLVDYNEAFQSLDMLSFVEFNLARTRTALDRLEGTSMREPASVISASCDQSVIFLGNKTSYEVAQFSRNRDLDSLERVGTIKLPGRPDDIAVDPAGEFALVVSSENRAIMRFGNDVSNTSGDRIIGDADVRELQRKLTEIGIPVGSIDGIIGEKTRRAVGLAERRYGVELNPELDIKKSIESLKAAVPQK